MYVPEHFREEDSAVIHAFMRANPFATLVTTGPSGPLATHLPTVLNADTPPLGVVECHLARANGHWKTFDGTTEALMIFHGPHAYIRPGWYPSKAEEGKAVPTWNYAVVHAYGRAEVIQDAAWLERHVAELSDHQEQGKSEPWSLAEAPERYVAMMLRGIVGVRFEVTRLEGKWKMSQNRTAADRDGAADGLVATDAGEADCEHETVERMLQREVAAEMRRRGDRT